MNSSSKEIVISVFSAVIKIVIVIVSVMLIYKYSSLAYEYGYRIFAEPPMVEMGGREISVSISASMSVKDIGELLENKGLIRDANLFVFQEIFSEYKGGIKPGIYSLSTTMTAEDMLRVMSGEEEE